MIIPNKTIIMADSCSGGISVLKYINTWAGDYNVEYLADYEKNPFGLKSSIEIENIVESWFKNLVNKDDTCLFIIACNTASIASMRIKQRLIDDFGVPIINMVDGLKECVEINKSQIIGKNVAIMATKYTIESGLYQEIIGKYQPNRIIGMIAINSEKEVAMGRFKTADGKIIIKNELERYSDQNIDTVILGCTCFKAIESQIIEMLGPNVKCIDPAKNVSDLVMKELRIKIKTKNPKLKFWNTSQSENTYDSIDIMCKANIKNNVKINYLKLSR